MKPVSGAPDMFNYPSRNEMEKNNNSIKNKIELPVEQKLMTWLKTLTLFSSWPLTAIDF